jgi:hypothetical protein
LTPQPADTGAPEAVSPDLRGTLAALARAHDQKTQLAFYEDLQAAVPFSKTDPAIHAFFVNMGKEQKDLLSDIKGWAKTNHVDLTYHAGTDLAGKAQVIEEARQEKEIRAANHADFLHIALIQMYMDYDWQVSLIQATLPSVKDEGLKAYLEKSLKVHEAGSDEALALLKKFKYVP